MQRLGSSLQRATDPGRLQIGAHGWGPLQGTPLMDEGFAPLTVHKR